MIVFVPSATGGIFRVSAEGGEPAEIVRPDSSRRETGLRFPQFLPDGEHFTFVSLPAKQGHYDVSVASLGSSRRHALPSSGAAPAYADPGWLVYVRSDRLVAQRFDARRMAVSGEPQVIGEAPQLSNFSGASAVSISRDGILARPGGGLVNTELVWFDRAGRRGATLPLPPGRWGHLSFAPDGRRLTIERAASAAEADLWMFDMERSLASRFTFMKAAGTGHAVWSPDGRWVAFNSDRDGTRDIYRKAADGTGDEERLHTSPALFKSLAAWSPDGRMLVFSQPDPATGWDILLLPVAGDRTPVPWLRTRFNENPGGVSPDGRWLAYNSDESGRNEVYVQSFPTAGSKYQVSTGGAVGGFWSSRGDELMYIGQDGSVMSVPVSTAGGLRVGTPRVLFRSISNVISGSVTPDHSRFLLVMPVGAVSDASITLELNWQAALKR